MEFVDLSGPVEDGQPVYRRWQTTRFWVSARHDNGKPMNRVMLLSEHGPTHVDAFTHLDEDSDASIDRIPLERFYTEGIAVDCSDVGSDEWITRDRLEARLAAHGLTVEPGDTVLLHTGHRERTYGLQPEEKATYMAGYTGLDEEAAYWLADRGVGNLGVDAPSMDHAQAAADRTFPVHTMCAEREVLHMENMANLGAVAGERFRFVAFPLALQDGTGSPIRPVAILEE